MYYAVFDNRAETRGGGRHVQDESLDWSAIHVKRGFCTRCPITSRTKELNIFFFPFLFSLVRYQRPCFFMASLSKSLAFFYLVLFHFQG